MIPALIRKFHDARVSGASHVVVWGSGKPRREFLHVDDLADAAVFLMQTYDDAGIVNIGTRTDIEVGELARTIAKITGFDWDIVFDTSQPDGTPRKLLGIPRLERLACFNLHVSEGR